MRRGSQLGIAWQWQDVAAVYYHLAHKIARGRNYKECTSFSLNCATAATLTSVSQTSKTKTK